EALGPGVVAQARRREPTLRHRPKRRDDRRGHALDPVRDNHRDRGSPALRLAFLCHVRNVADQDPAWLCRETGRLDRARGAAVRRARRDRSEGENESAHQRTIASTRITTTRTTLTVMSVSLWILPPSNFCCLSAVRSRCA